MINHFKMRTESFYCRAASRVKIKTDSGGLGWVGEGEGGGGEVAEVSAKDPPTVCRPHPPPQPVLRPAASKDAMHLLCSKKVDVLPLAGGQDSRHSALSLSLSLARPSFVSCEVVFTVT